MMRFELREEDPNVNMMLRNGAAIGEEGETNQGRRRGSQGDMSGS